MKNKMLDLNDHLFAELERLSDEDLKGEDLEYELKRAEMVSKTAQSIINNADLMIRASKHYAEYGIKTPKLLSTGDDSNA